MMKISVSINDQTQEFDLAARPLIIGRASHCDLQPTGAGAELVSSKHALLKLRDGAITIEDLGSSNGTFINDERCVASTALKDSDEVRLGRQGPTVRIRKVTVASAASSVPANKSVAQVGQRDFFGSSTPSAAAQPNQNSASPVAGSVNPIPFSNAGSPAIKSSGNTSEPSTRALLIKAQRQNFIVWIVVGVLCAGMLFGGIVVVAILGFGGYAAVNQIAAKTEEMSDEINAAQNLQTELYRKCALSTALIQTESTADGNTYQGSGFLVDRERGYILTNHHVIENAKVIIVFFPVLKPDGGIENELSHYFANVDPLIAEVVTTNPQKDLALIRVRLGSEHSHVTTLKLADEVPPNGTEVFTFGSPVSVDGVGWTFSNGVVKNFIKDFTGQMNNGQVLEADVIVTTNTIEGGDSGGPVVNSEGRVVAVVSNSSPDARLQNQFIALTEVLTFYKPYMD